MRRLLFASLYAVTLAMTVTGRAARPLAASEAAHEAAHATVLGDDTRSAARRVAAAARLRETEAAVASRAAEVSSLSERRDAAAAGLRDRAAALAPMLPLMQRLALFPAETLLAAPGPPEDALRGLGVMRGVVAHLEHEAAALRAEEADLAARSRAVDEALGGLRVLQAQQEAESRALDGQVAEAQRLRQAAGPAGAEASRLAAAEAGHADTLRTAMASLEAARARGEAQARDDAARAERQRQDAAAQEARRRQQVLAHPQRPALEAQGETALPVAGAVVQAWGARTDAGPATGMSFRAAPNAHVVAPCGGRVRFAGPFRSYGALLILDCGNGYAFVLAGLERLDVVAGTAVLPGEPVGVMPGWNPTAPGTRPALYVELRRDGQAVDPTPFLRARG